MSETAPFYDDIAEAPAGASVFWRQTPDGTRIRGAVWRGGTRGTVLLFPGRTEYIEKYGPVIARLTSLGFCVLCNDWRGQGLSDRPDGSTALGDVEDFSLYQSDVEALLSSPEVSDLPGPRILFSHSMGGCIGLRTLLRHPDISAAVFSAPMWGIGMSPPIRLIARLLVSAAPMFGAQKKHVPGTSATFYAEETGFDENSLTSDPAQLEKFKSHLSAHPELGLGGPSLRWMGAAFAELKDLFDGPKPDTPILTFLGSDEAIVDTGAIERMMPLLPNAELVICPGARHEIWMEQSHIQTPVWQKIEAFLAEHATARR